MILLGVMAYSISPKVMCEEVAWLEKGLNQHVHRFEGCLMGKPYSTVKQRPISFGE